MPRPTARFKSLPAYPLAAIPQRKRELIAQGVDVIDLGAGDADLAPPPAAVEALAAAARDPAMSRYGFGLGLPAFREAVSAWMRARFGHRFDPLAEVIPLIGSKEGLAHLALATVERGDAVLVPNPAYPIHPYGFVIAGADIRHVPLTPDVDFFAELEKAIRDSWPKPKMLVLNFPANPTTQCVDLAFFERVIAIAREHNIWVVHDLAYADIVFDGYVAPSILQVPGAKDVAVEFFTLSKSYNMPGWRVGFMCGNEKLVGALAKLKSYFDYGTFTPIQVAAILALEGPQDCVEEIRLIYQKRRDVMCAGLEAAGWPVERPKATMFVWAQIPGAYRSLGSLEFSKKLLAEAKVAVSPGIGFGEYGDQFVRFSLIENEHRTRQALRSVREVFRRERILVHPRRGSA